MDVHGGDFEIAWGVYFMNLRTMINIRTISFCWLLMLKCSRNKQQQTTAVREEREEMEKTMQQMQKVFREREASYERQIASLKEEAISAQRRVQVCAASLANFRCNRSWSESSDSSLIEFKWACGLCRNWAVNMRKPSC
jgi:hypothetical protein